MLSWKQGAPEARRLGRSHVVTSVLQELMFLKAKVGQCSPGLCGLSYVLRMC